MNIRYAFFTVGFVVFFPSFGMEERITSSRSHSAASATHIQNDAEWQREQKKFLCTIVQDMYTFFKVDEQSSKKIANKNLWDLIYKKLRNIYSFIKSCDSYELSMFDKILADIDVLRDAASDFANTLSDTNPVAVEIASAIEILDSLAGLVENHQRALKKVSSGLNKNSCEKKEHLVAKVDELYKNLIPLIFNTKVRDGVYSDFCVYIEFVKKEQYEAFMLKNAINTAEMVKSQLEQHKHQCADFDIVTVRKKIALFIKDMESLLPYAPTINKASSHTSLNEVFCFEEDEEEIGDENSDHQSTLVQRNHLTQDPKVQAVPQCPSFERYPVSSVVSVPKKNVMTPQIKTVGFSTKS